MADFTDIVDPSGSVEPDALANPATTEQHQLFTYSVTSGDVSPAVFQRIYDSTAGYVYYTQEGVNPAPAFDETTPNHTNNLDPLTHEVIKES